MCAHTYTSMHTHLIVSENNYAEKKLYQHYNRDKNQQIVFYLKIKYYKYIHIYEVKYVQSHSSIMILAWLRPMHFPP